MSIEENLEDGDEHNQATEMTAGAVREEIYDPDDLDAFSSGDESDHLDRNQDEFELVVNVPKQYTKRMTARRQKRNAEFSQWWATYAMIVLINLIIF